MPNESNNPELTVPIGTHVVTRVEIQIKDSDASRPAGSVGLITGAPAGIVQTYDIRLSDGSDTSLRREQFSIRKQARQDVLNTGDNINNDVISSYIIYKCTVGSRAYGLECEESDTDIRGFFCRRQKCIGR